jgi:hypothetical protein
MLRRAPFVFLVWCLSSSKGQPLIAVEVDDTRACRSFATAPVAWRNGRKEASCINTHFHCFANRGFGVERVHLATAPSALYSTLLETLLRR